MTIRKGKLGIPSKGEFPILIVLLTQKRSMTSRQIWDILSKKKPQLDRRTVREWLERLEKKQLVRSTSVWFSRKSLKLGEPQRVPAPPSDIQIKPGGRARGLRQLYGKRPVKLYSLPDGGGQLIRDELCSIFQADDNAVDIIKHLLSIWDPSPTEYEEIKRYIAD